MNIHVQTDCSQNHTGEGTTDTDQSPTYLSQYKITSENGKWSYTHIMQMLVDNFCNTSVARFHISTAAHRASLSCQRKAMERSENATSSRSTAWPTTYYHAYWKCNAYMYLRNLDLQRRSFPLYSYSQMKWSHASHMTRHEPVSTYTIL